MRRVVLVGLLIIVGCSGVRYGAPAPTNAPVPTDAPVESPVSDRLTRSQRERLFVEFLRDWSADQSYITLVDASTDRELIRLADLVCEGFDAGLSGLETMEAVILTVPEEFYEDATSIIGAGVAMLCPEHVDKFE